MPTVGIGNFIHAQTICLMQNQLGIMTFNFVVNDVVNTVTDQGIANDLSEYMGLLIKPLMTTHASYRGVRVQLRTDVALYQPVYSTLEQGQGSVAGDPLPKQTCGVVSRKTARSGRKYQGRVYVPFPGEGDNDPTAGRPSAGYIARLDAFKVATYDDIFITEGVGQATLQQVHFPNGGPFTLANAQAYVSAVSRPYWATQRRRGDFGPQNISPI